MSLSGVTISPSLLLGSLNQVALAQSQCSWNNIIIQPKNDNLVYRHGASWQTCNGYKLVFQYDNNLVLYRNGNAIWASNTRDSGANRLAIQTDGNLVLYKGTTPVWNTNTGDYPGAFLAIQTDGNVVLYDTYTTPPTPIWATGTRGR